MRTKEPSVQPEHWEERGAEKREYRLYQYGLPGRGRHPANPQWLSELFEWMESCILAVTIILLLFVFLGRTATVSGPSMQPTLYSGDRLLLWEMGAWDPAYGEIVVIDRTQSGEPPIIKRVIGKAGDHIDIDFTQGTVFRNGALLEEPYIQEPTFTNRGMEFPLTVPEGYLFVMGDNRNHSSDSRDPAIGLIDLRRVMGKAVFRFSPAKDAGWL